MSDKMIKSIVEKLKTRVEYTPDIRHLRRMDCIPLFVYGNLKQHENYNHLLKGAVYLGKAKSCTGMYVLKESMPGDQGVLLQDNSLNHQGYIKGEVYGVKDCHLLLLDKFLGNGTYYKREYRNFFLLEQPSVLKVKAHPSMRCFVYIGKPENWPGLRSSTRYTSNLDKKVYYNYYGTYQSNLLSDLDDDDDDFRFRHMEAPVWGMAL